MLAPLLPFPREDLNSYWRLVLFYISTDLHADLFRVNRKRFSLVDKFSIHIGIMVGLTYAALPPISKQNNPYLLITGICKISQFKSNGEFALNSDVNRKCPTLRTDQSAIQLLVFWTYITEIPYYMQHLLSLVLPKPAQLRFYVRMSKEGISDCMHSFDILFMRPTGPSGKIMIPFPETYFIFC